METTVDPSAISWDERGLAPCIVQDWRTGEVLTLDVNNCPPKIPAPRRPPEVVTDAETGVEVDAQ